MQFPPSFVFTLLLVSVKIKFYLPLAFFTRFILPHTTIFVFLIDPLISRYESLVHSMKVVIGYGQWLSLLDEPGYGMNKKFVELY